MIAIENANSFVVHALTNFVYFFSLSPDFLHLCARPSVRSFIRSFHRFYFAPLFMHYFFSVHRIFLFGLYLNVLAICAFKKNENKIKIVVWVWLCTTRCEWNTLSMKMGCKRHGMRKYNAYGQIQCIYMLCYTIYKEMLLNGEKNSNVSGMM